MTRRHRGFTLIELMISLIVLSMISLTVAGVWRGISTGYSNSQRHQQNLQMARVGMAKVHHLVRDCELVTAWDKSNYGSMSMWWEDSNDDGHINISELRLVGELLQPGKIHMIRNVFPDGMGALDVTVKHGDVDSVNKVFGLMISNGPYMEMTLLMEDVRQFELRPDDDSPETRSVDIRLEVGSSDASIDLRSTATIRKYEGGSTASWPPDP
jgi:prepilin-type N-terminal cleavage/methylation domain-containing protein